MAGQKLSYTINLDGSSKTVADLRKLRAELLNAIDIPDKSPGLDSLLGKIPNLAFAYNQVTQSVQGLLGQLKPVYDLLIGANEDLNQQLLQSAATITATSKILQNGVEIKDPTESIKALQPQLKKAIADVEKSTQDLVGVTSAQTSAVFNTILSNVGLLNDQLQGLGGKGQEFTNAIDAASSLAPGLVATLGTLGLPIGQAADEVGNLLKGEIDSTAQVARSLGITREMVQNWKAQGTLVAELNKRFEPFVKANALAARSVGGLTSNIQDIVEIVGRTAGAPLLGTLVDQLDQVFQLLKSNQGQITSTATDAVQIISNLLNTAITSITQILNALAPSLQAIGQAIGDAFGAGAVTAQTTIENLTAVVVQAIQIATPFVQLLSSLASGIAEVSATPVGQNLIQFGLVVAGVNLALPKLAAALGGVFTAVGAVESTFNNLLPILSQTNIAKTALTAKETALAIATGTSTAATELQAIAQAKLTIGDYAGAAAATEMAAAEQAKAISLQQSAGAIAGNVAKLGLLAAAVGSIALAVNEFQDITKEAQNTQKGVSDINAALAKLDEARAAANATNAQGAQATQEAVAANVALIQAGLNPVTQTLDRVIEFINQVTSQFNTLLKSPAANFIPGLREIKVALTAIGQEGFPELSTGAEAAVTQAKLSFSDLKTSVDNTFQEIGAVTKDAEGKYQFPSLVGKSKEELEAYTKSIDASISALEASRPVNAADLKYKNDNIAALKAAKAAIESNTGSVQIQSRELENQGTIYAALNKQVENAQRTLATSGDQAQVNSAAKSLADLTQQQFELGRISAEEAQKRLTEIANNGKVEIGTRQAAQGAIAKIQEQAAQQRVAQFQTAQSEIDRLQAQGVISDAEAEKRRTANKQKELQSQLDSVRGEIAAEEKAISEGRGSKTRLDQLKKQEVDLTTQTAQAKAAAEKAGLDQRTRDIEKQLEDANAATQQAEQSRQIQIQALLNQGVISQKEADRLKADSNKESLQRQFDAEQQHLADLKALPTPSDPEEREKREKDIRESLSKTGQLQLSLLQAEQQAQEAVRQQALDAIKDRLETTKNAVDQIKNATAQALLANAAQNKDLEVRASAERAVINSLDQQKKLLDSRRNLQESLNNLAETEAKIRQDGLTEGLSLTERLKTEEDSRVRSLIRQRLQSLGIYGSEEQIAKKLADQQRKDAIASLNRLAQKQQYDRISLDLQIKQEQSQARSAVLEAQRNELAAKRQQIEAQQSVVDAKAAKADAQAALDEAQLTQDPEERRRAVAAAQRQVNQADRDLQSAQQNVAFSNEDLTLAREQTGLANENSEAQSEIAENSRAALEAQQQSEAAVAKQAADSAIFAANLGEAEARSKGINSYLGGAGSTGSTIPRRTGGDIQPGQIYNVHKDEMFVSNTGGYMLRRADAMRVAREAMGSGTGVSLGGVRSVTAAPSAGSMQLLSALNRLEKTMKSGGSGINIQSLSQSITNQVPKNEGAIARMVEDANLNLIRDLRNTIKRMG